MEYDTYLRDCYFLRKGTTAETTGDATHAQISILSMGSGVHNQRMQSTETEVPAAPRDGPLEWSVMYVLPSSISSVVELEVAGQQALTSAGDVLREGADEVRREEVAVKRRSDV